MADLESNRGLVRALLEVFPDRVPPGPILQRAVRLADAFHSGFVIQLPPESDSNTDEENEYLKDALVKRYAIIMNILVQYMRRLFRRSAKSRSCMHHFTAGGPA